MAKIIQIPVIIVYLLLSTGYNVLLHTCGEYTSVYLMPSSAEDPCNQHGSHSCCSMDPCCKMELKVFRINDSQIYIQNHQLEKTNLLDGMLPDTESSNLLQGHLLPIVPTNTSPPKIVLQHILDCSFLI
jgi:hypothetical protein